MNVKIKFLIFLIILFFIVIYNSNCIPKIDTAVTVTYESDEGEMLTFTVYEDSDPDRKILYLIPKFLRLNTNKLNGKPDFNLVVFKNLKIDVNPRKVRNSKMENQSGGFINMSLRLGLSGEEFESLERSILRKLKRIKGRSYRRYSLTYIPIYPGSAKYQFFLTDPLTGKNDVCIAGGQCGGDVGNIITGAVTLSDKTAALFKKTLEQDRSLSGLVKCRYCAEAEFMVPVTKIEVKASLKQCYQYVKDYFSIRGGWWWWSFDADLSRIRESLERTGNLKIIITRGSGNSLSNDEINKIKDDAVKNIINLFFKTDLKPDKPTGGNGKGWYSWSVVSTGYSRVDYKQEQIYKGGFTYELKGIKKFPIYIEADITEISKECIIIADLMDRFSTVGRAIIKAPKDLLNQPSIDGIDVYVKIGDYQETYSFDKQNKYDQIMYYWVDQTQGTLTFKNGKVIRNKPKIRFKVSVIFEEYDSIETDWTDWSGKEEGNTTMGLGYPSITIFEVLKVCPIEVGEYLFSKRKWKRDTLLQIKVYVKMENGEIRVYRFNERTMEKTEGIMKLVYQLDNVPKSYKIQALWEEQGRVKTKWMPITDEETKGGFSIEILRYKDVPGWENAK